MVCTYNETFFSLKQKKILTHVTIWMNLEDSTQSGKKKKKQPQEDKYCVIPLIWGT